MDKESNYLLPNQVDLVRAAFTLSGVSVADWARNHGFSTALVYQVLDGRRKCFRGQSHQIAVALGLKTGVITAVGKVDQLIEDMRKTERKAMDEESQEAVA